MAMGPHASVIHGMMIFGVAISLRVLLSAVGLVRRKGWARISFIVICTVGVIGSLIYLLVGLAGIAAIINSETAVGHGRLRPRHGEGHRRVQRSLRNVG